MVALADCDLKRTGPLAPRCLIAGPRLQRKAIANPPLYFVEVTHLAELKQRFDLGKTRSKTTLFTTVRRGR